MNALFTSTKGAAADRRGYCRRQRWLWMVSESASAAPLPLIFAGEIQESAGGNEGANEGGRNVHYFSAASHDRFLARRRQTKIPPRKPRTDLGFRQSVSSGEKILPYPKVHFCSNTSWLCSASPARKPGFLESPLDSESVLPKSMCREASQRMSLVDLCYLKLMDLDELAPSSPQILRLGARS